MKEETQEEKQEYKIEETKRQEITIENEGKTEDPMGDVYDVYAKASKVHSKISNMTDDYTLTRYDIDIYNEKFPKFIREQRKVLRIIRSYLIVPEEKLREFYNNKEKAREIRERLEKEYKEIKALLLGEIDDCVIMARTPRGEIIDSFLKHGLNMENREEYDNRRERPTTREKLNEKER